MPYTVKELYYTLQGEGAQAGRAAVFCRFAGCNLWSGLEEDRATAICRFCDTDFVGTDGAGGGRFETAAELARAASQVRRAAPLPSPPRTRGSSIPAPADGCRRGNYDDSERASLSPSALGDELRMLLVCTGGEPLLQLDQELVAAFHAEGFEVAVETNGTRPAPAGLDWITVSPKAGAELRLHAGDELKLVYPQPGAEPERYAGMKFRHFFLQPMDGPDRAENTRLAIEYCLRHPRWRLSVQTHKMLGIP